MAKARVGVEFTPVDAKKVEAALARIQAQAKGVNFGRGAESINKLSRPLGKITGQASEFQKSLEASNARVLAFGASVAVINKLSEAFGALVSNTIKVEATFAKINTILGGTQKQLEQFGNGIFKVAQQTGTSFDQVAEGALELARQGLSVEESLSRVSTALKLVRVSGIDANQAVAGLTAAIKGFEGAGLTVAQIADKLAEVDTKFAVSTEDLINGLERASASARVAGVSFDELLGVVTTVQERTQRGGAVIGNAFKTIFARLGRTDTLVALQDLGISVLDAEGNVRGAIPLFQELAVELNKLGLKSVEAGNIIQKVAGVRQRDILISLVEDLNSGQSQFAKSLQVSAGAAGALDAKNSQLNQTLEALINNLTVGGQKLASVLGEIGFTDAAKDILKALSSVVNGITDILQGEGPGAKFAQGLVKGIGSVLTGPGLALISAIFVKLFIDLAKFGANSLKQILGINKAAAQQNALQQSVLQTLLQNENIQREILALEGNKVAQEQLLLKIYNQQAAALARVQKAAATVTPGLFGAGLRGGERGVTRKGKAADGYIAAEARDVSRGVGGAPASSKVVSIPNFAFGGGKRGTMVANTSEYYVPNYAGGGDAIFNRDMVRSMGLPAGAKKINAAGGYVPNFARSKRAGASLPDDNTFKNLSLSELERKNPASLKGKALTDYNAALAVKRKGKKVPSNFNFNANKKIGVLSAFRGSSSTVATERFGKLSTLERGLFESVVGQDIKKPSTTISISGIQTKSLENIDRSKVSKFRKNIDKLFAPSLIEFAKSLIGGVGIKNDEFSQFSQIINKSRGNLFSTSVEGGIFESAIQLGTRSLKNISDFLSSTGDEQSPFDFEEGAEPASSLLKKSFGFSEGLIKADAKRTASGKAVNTLIGKSLRDNLIRGSVFKAAAGYIPNFAGGALEEAIGREKAAGLPISQIRINQSGKLRNAQNPMGLAVTNTRDEPTGAIPNFSVQERHPAGTVIGEKKVGGQFKSKTSAGGTSDLNDGLEKTSGALDGAITKIFALQLATSGLTSAFTEQDSIMGRFGEAASSAINTMLVLSTVGVNPLGGFAKGGALRKGFGTGGFKGMFTAFKGITGVLGKLKAVAGPVALAFTALSVGLKAFTGKGVFGHVMSGLESLGLVLSQESKNIQNSLNELAQNLSGKSITEKITITQQRVREKVEEERQKEKVKAIAPFLNEKGIAFERNYRGKSSNRTVASTFKLDKEVLASLNTLYGELPTEEDIIKAFPDIDKTEVSNLFTEFSENFGKIEDNLVDAAKSGNKNKVASKLGELQKYYEKLFIELGKIGNIGDAAAEAQKKRLEANDNLILAGSASKLESLKRKGSASGLYSTGGLLLMDSSRKEKTRLAHDTLKVNEIELRLAGNLSKLERERLEANKALLEFKIGQSKASTKLGAQLGSNVVKALEGKAVEKEKYQTLLDSIEAGKSFEEVLEAVDDLREKGLLNSKTGRKLSSSK
jgi:TP901 family phage tail tape measure protein